jgi:translation initiation factor 1
VARKEKGFRDDDGGAGGSSPFAALQKLRDALPPGEAPQATTAGGAPSAAASAARGPARAVIRLERKGRGGKEATIVEHLDLAPDVLEQWLRALKGQLGCGGTVEEGTLVLAGDQRERLPGLLEARGVRKVIRG